MAIPIRAAALALLVAGAAFPATAETEAPGKSDGRQCFWARNVTNFNAVDDRTVNIRVGVRDVYRMELLGPCPDIDWTQTIGIVSRGGSWICSGLDAEIVTPSPIGRQRCAVRDIRKLTPEEAAALPAKEKP